MRKSRLGIRSQLVAGIVLTTLAGIGLIGLLSIKMVENSAIYGKISEAESVVRFVAAAFRAPSPARGPDATLNYVSAAMREARITDFSVTGPSSRALVQGGLLPPDRGARISYPGEIKVWRKGGGFLSGPGDYLYISAPLESAGMGPGKVEFTVPLADINEDMAGVRRFLLLYAVLDTVIIVCFGAFFLSRSIVTPIKKLDQAATRIAGGALGERARVAVDNEIGSLAGSFNIMADRLEEEIKSLERVNSELLSTQEELLRSSTLAVVGRLAAGIAHEIGNPLGAVRGYLDILSKGPLDKDEEKEVLERAGAEVARIDLIVREFLEVSRPSRKEPDSVDVNGLVEETISTLSVHRDFEGVEVETRSAAALPPVAIDARKLRQVFMNLLLNAAHSMDGKAGRKAISVETGVEGRQAEPYRPRRRKDDAAMAQGDEGRGAVRDFVFIRFTDAGRGISDEDRAHIFEPFYTTKDVGKGTGLGLFVSQSIIKAYGGEITLATKPGDGSSFTVALPAKGGR